MMQKRGLGKGLSALMKEVPAVESPQAVPATAPAAPSGGVRKLPLSRILKSPFQPRHTFAREAMDDLVLSVKERGVVQPLLVRVSGEHYELIAGERRLRAAEEAGLKEVPVIIIEATDKDALELALVENLQREDLNVIEQAEGYKRLAEQFSMNQEQIALRVGKARASIANTMRLLDLPADVKTQLAEGALSTGHAKVLLGLTIPEEQALLAKQAIAEGLSVRDLERLVNRIKRGARKPRAERDDISPNHMVYVADLLRRRLGTSVKVVSSRTLANGRKARGRMEIEFYSVEDFNRILDILGVTEAHQ